MARIVGLLGVLAAVSCGGGEPAPSVDGGVADAAPDARPDPPDPTLLSSRGLYAEPATRTVDPALIPFAPTHALWSDAADKRRWLRLPPGTQIDTSDLDRWALPVGAQLWKEFSKDGVLLETRLIERTGEGPEDFFMGSFVWREDQSDAVFREAGARDINGTGHDAPAAKFCWSCHAGEPGRALGLSALQLSRDGEGTTLRSLAEAGLLSHPPAAPVPGVPGDPATARALGYLHANCGHCHNPLGQSFVETEIVLRVEAGARTLEETGAYRTAVGQRLDFWRHPTLTHRVVPGDPDASAIVVRMASRAYRVQMPPLATEVVDDAGLALVRAWITGLR